jgi:predicted Fe-Mo cluster-binding NifX family protein
MKFAIPTADKKLCMHFGHCESFAILEVPEDGQEVDVEYIVPPPHEPGVLPRWLGEQGVNVIIAGGMGQRAQVLFKEQNIDVVVGASQQTPVKLVTEYLAGSLKSGVNACDH